MNSKPEARTIGVVGIGSEEAVMGQTSKWADPNPHYAGPPFGDVRDMLVRAPRQAYDDLTGSYVCSDLFPSKHDTMRALVPDASSVFEIGAFHGHFLLTALQACPGIRRVFWADSEADMPGSNQLVKENVEWWAAEHLDSTDKITMSWAERAYPVCLMLSGPDTDPIDIIHVDGLHILETALSDITMALMLKPRLLLVDDTIAHEPVLKACQFASWNTGVEHELVVTVNGYAVFQP